MGRWDENGGTAIRKECRFATNPKLCEAPGGSRPGPQRLPEARNRSQRLPDAPRRSRRLPAAPGGRKAAPAAPRGLPGAPRRSARLPEAPGRAPSGSLRPELAPRGSRTRPGAPGWPSHSERPLIAQGGDPAPEGPRGPPEAPRGPWTYTRHQFDGDLTYIWWPPITPGAPQNPATLRYLS